MIDVLDRSGIIVSISVIRVEPGAHRFRLAATCLYEFSSLNRDRNAEPAGG